MHGTHATAQTWKVRTQRRGHARCMQKITTTHTHAISFKSASNWNTRRCLWTSAEWYRHTQLSMLRPSACVAMSTISTCAWRHVTSKMVSSQKLIKLSNFPLSPSSLTILWRKVRLDSYKVPHEYASHDVHDSLKLTQESHADCTGLKFGWRNGAVIKGWVLSVK